MQERERGVITGLVVLLLVFWLGFVVHRSPRFAGSVAGGVLGVSGALLMLLAGGYVLVKRVDRVKKLVTRKISMATLLTWHVYLGISGAILGLLHTGHKFQSTVPMLLTASMLAVVFSGYIGRYLLKQVSQEVREKRELLSRLQQEYDAAAAETQQHPQAVLASAGRGMWTQHLAGFFAPQPSITAENVSAIRAVQLAGAIADVEYSVRTHDALKLAFNRWLKVHIAVSILLYILLSIHIWSGIRYGLRWFQP